MLSKVFALTASSKGSKGGAGATSMGCAGMPCLGGAGAPEFGGAHLPNWPRALRRPFL